MAAHFGAGGCIDHGNVVLRSRQFESDANKLVEHIRSMVVIAKMIDP